MGYTPKGRIFDLCRTVSGYGAVFYTKPLSSSSPERRRFGHLQNNNQTGVKKIFFCWRGNKTDTWVRKRNRRVLCGIFEICDFRTYQVAVYNISFFCSTFSSLGGEVMSLQKWFFSVNFKKINCLYGGRWLFKDGIQSRRGYLKYCTFVMLVTRKDAATKFILTF